MAKHKHSELIKAWADGAEIEIHEQLDRWRTIANPAWNTFEQYRVKPEVVAPIYYYQWERLMSQDWISCTNYVTDKEAERCNYTEDGYRKIISSKRIWDAT